MYSTNRPMFCLQLDVSSTEIHVSKVKITSRAVVLIDSSHLNDNLAGCQLQFNVCYKSDEHGMYAQLALDWNNITNKCLLV